MRSEQPHKHKQICEEEDKMDTFEKIDIWFKTWKAQSKIKYVPTRIKKNIPITVKKDFYIKTIVKAHKDYNNLMWKYAKKHKL